jgi:hypothetical protein
MRSPAFLDRGCEPKSAGPASEYDARHRQFLPWRTIREPIRTRQETLHVSLPEADIARPRKNQSKASTPTVVIPLVLVCLAVALILISAFLIPASLQTPGIESFMVGP